MRSALLLAGVLCAAPLAARAHDDPFEHAVERARAEAGTRGGTGAADAEGAAHHEDDGDHGRAPGFVRAIGGGAAIVLAFAALTLWHRRRQRG